MKAKPGFHSMNKYFWEANKTLNNVIFSNMDGPRDCHIEWSKSDRERQIYDIIYMWNLKIKCTNEFDYKTEIES